MQERRSVYNAGATDGMIMGIYLSAMFLLQAIGKQMIVMLLLGDVMLLAIPVVTYILLRRGYDATHGYKTFSAVWLHGIIIFLCGSLIMAMVVYIFTRFVQPSFIYDQLKMLIDAYSSLGTDDARQMASIFQQLIDRHMLPSPISLAFSLIWFVSFFGAMLSCLLALIIKLRRRTK